MAQETLAGYRHFTVDEGLPSSEVYEILQDRQGFIWFATDNGLSRFNGYQFENFGSMEGLEDPVVFFLQEDAKGRIWTKSMSPTMANRCRAAFSTLVCTCSTTPKNCPLQPPPMVSPRSASTSRAPKRFPAAPFPPHHSERRDFPEEAAGSERTEVVA